MLLTNGMDRVVVKRFGSDSGVDLSWLDETMATSVSRDGQLFTFLETNRPGKTEPGYSLFVRNVDGSPPRLMGNGLAIAITPDGTRVVELTAGSVPALTVQPTGGGTRVILPRGEVVQYESHTVAISPDGSTVAFTGASRDGAARMWVQPLDGSAPPHALGEPGLHAAGYWLAYTPDGKNVVARARDDRLALVPLDGTSSRPIPRTEGAMLVTVREDGAIVCCSWGPNGLDAITPATGARTRIMSIPPAEVGARFLCWITATPDLSTILVSYEVVNNDLYVVSGETP
jgi:hypothetical protein